MVNDMDKKMLVLDIDGTLTNSKKEITHKTLNRILQIQKQGHIVVLASGRPTPGMKKVAETIQLSTYGGYVLSFNGAKVANCKTGEIVFQQRLSSEYAAQIYETAKKYDLGMVTYDETSVLLGTRSDAYIEMEARINGMPIKKLDNFKEYVNFDVNKCLVTAEPDVSEGYMNMFADMFQGQLSVCRSEPFFIEIMPQNVDKAASVERLVKALGIKQENVICCGDGYNDISMIRYAGTGVAMANAREEVKAAADYITLSNDEDGIADVIERLIA